MCFVSILECFLCRTKYNAKRLIDFAETRNVRPPRFINVKRCCGYWYCLFNNKDVILTNYSDRVDQTCGDQLCESENCKLSVRTVDCCYSGEHQHIPEIEECNFEKAVTILPHSVDCYLDPCLTAPEVERVLYNVLQRKDFRVFGAGRQMEFENEMYVFAIDGDVDQIKLTVTVSRKSGELCPQVYIGSFNRFLALAFWKEQGKNSRLSLKDFFSVEKVV